MWHGDKASTYLCDISYIYLELRLYEKIEEKFGQEFRKEFKEQWGRYLDDCFINCGTQCLQKLQIYTTPSTPCREELSLLWKLTQLKTPFSDPTPGKRYQNHHRHIL